MVPISRFRWISAACSDTGRVRAINEDACLDEPQRGLWAVADGMGGHDVGDVASRLVIDACAQLADTMGIKQSIVEARATLQTANQQLREEASRRQVPRIGTTVVMLLARDRFCGFLWAGDSRVYLLRQGELRQLTRDHSQVEELRQSGYLTQEEARHHPARNIITRAIGATDHLDLDEDTIEVADGDVFLLCSDGLSNELSDEEIARTLANVDCLHAPRELVDMALARGGRDNITAIVVQAEDPQASDKTLLNPAP